ncbi:TonB-dependent receptor domain-containing protein [Cyclobacterium jeungdonense]|uniref:TonB-dependent receptor n=1 Tax=Cyclobacterium jeungdonense TaxID=708087 RepID=A0ABT8C8P6_9BACT|nr:TonB-dependent receptor [Cyclobacterium jeungdonense]MDN3688507.1 TonB-dependent receptor [Cyclobacterium jeungdonense]
MPYNSNENETTRKWNGVATALLLGLMLLAWVGVSFQAQAQSFAVSGTVLIKGEPCMGTPKIVLRGSSLVAEVNSDGNFTLLGIPAGEQTLVAFCLGKKMVAKVLEINQDIDRLEFVLADIENELEDVQVDGRKVEDFAATRLQSVENFGVYDGRKSEVIVLKEMVANTATNNARQVYSRITGLNIWESDQTGLQLGIGGRGLSPNRTSNFNVRQNGYDISADALGYPESYYTPPVEALERIEVVRGAASLQYGTQFGGMLNFRFRRGTEDAKIRLTSRQSGGSWGFFGSFNSLEGKVGNLRYYTYYQHKSGNGYRPNSGFKAHNFYTSLDYTFSEKFSGSLELTKMNYLTQQAGGLTDRQFQENPRRSFRDRNWFNVDWNLGALTFTYNFSDQTKLNTRNFALLASRQSIGNLERINVADFGEERTLISGDFRNFGNETRLLHWYRLGKETQTFLVGTRAYHGTTTAKQGWGSRGSDADFRYLNPDDLEDSDYAFPNRNYAVFAENIINLSPKLSLTPGVRLENIQTFADGYYKQYVYDGAGNVLVENRFDEELERRRSFLLFGLGSSYRKNEAVEFYANVSQNYRAINFTDLRINNPNLRVDPNITDERGYTADLGIKGSKEELFTYEVTLFYLRYFGKIGQVLRTDSVLFNDYRYRTNIADARNLGVEAFGEFSLLNLLRKDENQVKWTVFGNFSVIDARYIRTEDTAIRNRKVEMVPPVTLKLGSTFRYKGFSVSGQYSYVDAHFSDASNAVRTATAVEGLIPSYSVADISAIYRWKSFALEMSINNLFNEQYFTRRADAYPGPGIIPADGRGFYATFEMKF